jgi:hypothetical protein
MAMSANADTRSKSRHTAETSADVHADAVATIERAIADACGFFADRTDRILAANDLRGDSQWFALADYISAFDDLLDSTGDHTVRRIGKELAHTLSWPRGTDSVPAALDALDEAHSGILRGDAGDYEFTRTGAESGRLVCRTPYPTAVEQGLLRGLGQRFTDTGFLKSELVDSRREKGRLVSTYEIRWWESAGLDAADSPTKSSAQTNPHIAGAD